MQALFTNKLKKSGIELSFETNGIKLLFSLFSNPPAAVFINVKCQNPKSIEIVRLIKCVDKFSKLPVGLYATGDFSFSSFFLKNSGADVFVNFNEKTIAEDLQNLLALEEMGELSKPVQNDIMKNSCIGEIFNLIYDIESLPTIIEKFLKIVAEATEVPAVALFLIDSDGPAGYYVGSPNLSETDKNDFIKVCISDFENAHSDINMAQVVPHRFEGAEVLDKYYNSDVPLSSYQVIPLKNMAGEPYASLHIVKEGNFSTRQIDLLNYCAENVSIIIEEAIIVKKKIFFEKNIRKAFSRFVPEQIIDSLVVSADSEKSESVGEKRKVAILFSDIRSFTSISEKNKPETLVAFLNRYFTTMVNAIKRHGGTIDKFVGDAIMAEFGVPVSYEDNARRAVAAACEMREMLPAVPLEDLVLPDGMTFNIGIGIHYGDVTVGSIGSEDKTDYTVIGDSVNLASRLEGLTKTYGTMILVSEFVKEDIPDGTFTFRYLDDVKVKGKKNAVPIYAVDRSEDEFSAGYKDSYSKGFDLYKQGLWNLAKEYFEKALGEAPGDKAAALMLERCVEFIANPPENWDGAITFHTK